MSQNLMPARGANRLAVWLARTWLVAWFAEPKSARRHRSVQCLACACRCLGGSAPARSLDALMAILDSHAKAPISFAAPEATAFTPDETTLIRVLFRLQQRQPDDACDLLSTWLDGEMLDNALSYAATLALHMQNAGFALSLEDCDQPDPFGEGLFDSPQAAFTIH